VHKTMVIRFGFGSSLYCTSTVDTELAVENRPACMPKTTTRRLAKAREVYKSLSYFLMRFHSYISDSLRYTKVDARIIGSQRLEELLEP